MLHVARKGLCHHAHLYKLASSALSQVNQISQTSFQHQADHEKSWEPHKAIHELQSTPGWLKGPLGKHIVKALGEDEWAEVKDDKGSRWKNVKTGEVTGPGIPKPDTWTEVVDKKTGLLYYWSRRTGEATEIGEAKPGAYGRVKKNADEELNFRSSRQDSKPGAFTAIAELLKGPIGIFILGVGSLAAVIQMFNQIGASSSS